MELVGLLLLWLELELSCVAGYSIGPPDTVCSTLLPNHPSSALPGNGGYFITATNMTSNSDGTGYHYEANQEYTVTLTGARQFAGFAVQSVSVPGQNPIGRFTASFGQKVLDCSGSGTTITHANADLKVSQNFTWYSPSSPGTIDFLYTVVVARTEYYVRISAVAANPPPTPPRPPNASPLPGRVTIPTRSPADYRLRFQDPPHCRPSVCNTFIGMDTNAADFSYLDIYMEGSTQGWVAVGFSLHRDMFLSDVIGCNLNPDSGLVEVLDANIITERAVIIDTVQDAFLFFAQSTGGRISCTVGRSIAGTGGQQDLNFNGNYYILYGRRTRDPVAGTLASHVSTAPNPVVSSALFNPATSKTVIPLEVIEPTRSPANYRLKFEDPPGCVPRACTVFIGIDTNAGDSDYLDIYMEGDTQGWLAVGFSHSPDPFQSDVIVCTRNSSDGRIEVLDTSTNFSNSVDINHDTFLYSAENIGNRLSCMLGRLTAGTGSEDFNLDENYYVLYGRSPVAGAPTTNFTTPVLLSGMQVNPASDVISVSQIPSEVTTPTRAPNDYRLRFEDPPGCEPASASCTVFIGIDTNVGNSDYLDIYMEGDAQGWIAVGFSSTPNMLLADVIGCNIDPNDGLVEVLDSHVSTTRTAILDIEQNVFVFSVQNAEGRISCTVGRSIAGSGDQDVDFDDSYYILYGRRASSGFSGRLASHVVKTAPSPLISIAKYNPTNDTRKYTTTLHTEGSNSTVTTTLFGSAATNSFTNVLVRTHRIFILNSFVIFIVV